MRRATPWLLVAVLLVALAASLGDSGRTSPPQPVADVAAATTSPAPSPTVASAAHAERRSAATAPKAHRVPSRTLSSCDANIRVKAATTTCAFAQNVFYAYFRETLGSPDAVELRAWSPAAEQTFDVSCTGTVSITCRAGDGALIRFPARALAAYDDEQADRYAATHDIGPEADESDEPDNAGVGRNIPNYENGTGYRVQCADGMYSHSGGRPGACSGHGGVGPDPSYDDGAPEPDYGSGDEIPNYENGTGYRVQCADGMYSHSGGRPGACSGHGGVG